MNSTTGFPSVLALVDIPLAAATLLSSARFFGLMTTFPLFTWINLNGLIRAAIAIGLGFGVAQDSDIPGALMGQSIWFLVVLISKEIVVGALLGVLLGLPIWAAHIAGDIVDTFRGANASNIFDPLNSEELTISGQVNAMIAMSCLVAIGGLSLVIELVSLSFSILPVESLGLTPGHSIGPHFRAFMDRVVTYGMVVAAPLLVLMVIAEIGFSLQAKLARQMSLDNVAPAAKSLVYLTIIPVYGGFLYGYSENAFHQIFGEFFKLFGTL